MRNHLLVTFIVLAARVPVVGQIVSYEANSLFPEDEGTGWVRLPSTYQSERWLEGGCLIQLSELIEKGKVVFGQRDSYRRELDDMAGESAWFLQFRVITNTPPLYQDVGPASLAAGGNVGVLYHFVIGDSQMRFLRDVALPYVFVDIQPAVVHTYRLELRGADSYALWIDGEPKDSGVPEGPYPTADSGITFRGKASTGTNITRWEYIRFGVIPQPNSGDFDSNGSVDQDDLYFFVDCLLGPDYDAAGPGCQWADMNADGTANAADVQLFVNAMLAN